MQQTIEETIVTPKTSSEPPIPSRANDIWHKRSFPLDAMFKPRSIAIIGATENEGSVGRTLLENVRRGEFRGAIYPVNPKRPSVLGIKAFPSVRDIPGPVDLAVIVTPAPTVPGLVRECSQIGVPGAVVISAGFKEVGKEGAALEQQILKEARDGKMRIIGPNCLGIMRPHFGLNATFAASMARPGSVGFLSQSGALCTAILDWSFRENVGFSTFVSVGSMLDVGWGDLIYYLGDDPHTKSIVMYMESIGDARSFLSAAREVALTKPIIVIKVGRSEAAAKAAASHTGSMTGSDEILHAAFRRVGVLRVDTIAELFDMAEVLAKQPRPRGPRLAIVTNAGGPGALATDMLVGSGGQLAELSPEAFGALNEMLPGPWSHGNPVDVLGDAGADRYAKAVEIVAKDESNDGILVILTPQAMTDSAGTAGKLKAFAKLENKPILASWMGAKEVEKGEEILNHASIPTYKYPDRAAAAFSSMWRYSHDLKSLYETPVAAPESQDVAARRQAAEKIIKPARESGRTILTELESKRILSAYGIPTVESRLAHTADEAVKAAEELGHPVVLKLHSEVITHKTDVGGVQLNLRNATAVRRAFKAIEAAIQKTGQAGAFLGVTVQPMIQLTGYELIIGSSLDAQFGPVLLFGSGGQLVEVFRDRVLGLPPLNATLALRMMERTRIYQALRGVRGRKPVDIAALEQLLVRFSELVLEQTWIKELDINPLLASPERLLALDARVLVHGKDVRVDQLTRPAIRPYPTQYVAPWKMRDGTHVTLRPIRPEDELAIAKFHGTLSEQSVYYRYFSQLKLPERIAHDRLTRICFNDYDRELALVAECLDPGDGRHKILGVGRLSKDHRANEAEFALLVSDQWHGRGLGTELLRRLVSIGKAEKLERITGHVLAENRGMLNVCRKVGFELRHDPDAGEYEAVIGLKDAG